MIDLRLKKSSSRFEFVARVVHVCLGLAALGFCAWALPQAQPGYRWIVLALMLFSLIPVAIGLFGQRKTVLQFSFVF